MAVLLKKDSDLNLKEIQVTEEVVASEHEIGITIVIPQDTKIFSPEKNESIVLADQKIQPEEIKNITKTDAAVSSDVATEAISLPVLPSVIPTPNIENIAPVSLPAIEELIPLSVPVVTPATEEVSPLPEEIVPEVVTSPIGEDVAPVVTPEPQPAASVDATPAISTPVMTEVIIESDFSGETSEE